MKMNENYRLYHGDCLEIMPQLIDKRVKVDLVLTDTPYGTTKCKWDTVIPLEEMWKCIKEIRNDKTPVLIFGAEPFSSTLRMSNIKEYKYDWIWEKEQGANFMNVKYCPLKVHEIISVFYNHRYYPQMTAGKPYISGKGTSGDITGRWVKIQTRNKGTRYPRSILRVNTQKNKSVHPTQKPVKLLEYLIKTYTNENDVVLDFTMGSGSTGVACMNLNRKFIGIELEEKYYNIAEQRIKEATQSKQTTLM